MHPTNQPADQPLYRCGTLTYTKAKLAVLFFWLLWGDFCYMLMEAVVPSILPLQFKELGASNTEMGLILGTIPMAIGSVLNPIISFKSDRFRSRWGRRIPFIVATLPFLVASLVALGYGPAIGAWLKGLGVFGEGLTSGQAAIYTMGVLMVVFTFFNMFVSSVFWYLFNDVVPEHLLARFMSWFRIVSMGSAAAYNFCVFRFAGTHTQEIFIGAAVLYLVGFGMMCLRVKEGEYPPPQPYLQGKTGVVAAITTFVVECHALRHYWYIWLWIMMGGFAGAAVTFTVLFYTGIGLDLEQIGYVNGANNIAVGVLILGSGWLADRFHPLRVVMLGSLLNVGLVLPLSLIWLVWRPGPETAFWAAMGMSIGLAAPIAAMLGVWDPPGLMRLFPRSNYGQFCSNHAIWRNLGGILGGVLAGVLLDAMTPSLGKDRVYLLIPLWQILFGIPAIALLYLLYRSWKRHGGDEAYVAPVVDTRTGDATQPAGR